MISIIIPTFRRYEVLVKSISNLLCVDTYSPDDELIIVDNSSKVDLPCMTQIEKLCSGKIKFQYLNYEGLYPNDPNSLRNIAFRASHGDIVIIQDDDAFMMTPGWTKIVRDVFENQQDIAGLTGNIIEPEKPLIPWDGKSPIGRITPQGEIIGHFYKQPGSNIPVDHMRGCFMAFRRSALEITGGFDENVKNLYLDETELCVHLTKLGFKLFLVPGLVIDHRMAPRNRQIVARNEENTKTIYTKVMNTYYFFFLHYFFNPSPHWCYFVQFYRVRLSRLIKKGDLKVVPSLLIFPLAWLGAAALFLKKRVLKNATHSH